MKTKVQTDEMRLRELSSHRGMVQVHKRSRGVHIVGLLLSVGHLCDLQGLFSEMDNFMNLHSQSH